MDAMTRLPFLAAASLIRNERRARFRDDFRASNREHDLRVWRLFGDCEERGAQRH